MRTLYRAALVCAALLTPLVPVARAAEPDTERDRKARVALALAGAGSPSVAPMPRAVTTKDYAAGVKLATEQNRPLVVYVGCKGDHVTPAGAVVARAETLPDVDGPAAVVLYPVGADLYQHAVMPCPVEEERLAQAVKAAAKKVDAPAKSGDKAAPKPLEWDISADVKEACPNCETCPHCGKGLKEKPAPAAAKDVHVSPDGTQNERHPDGIYRPIPGAPKVAPPGSAIPARVPAYLPGYPAAPSSCPGGTCPTAPRYVLPVR